MNRVWIVLLLGSAACSPSSEKSSQSVKPATVDMPQEDNIAVLTLTPKAVERLGIATVDVEQKSLPRSRTLGGEVIARPGAALTVSAPLAGLLGKNAENPLPAAGASVMQGAAVLDLLPIFSPQARVDFAVLGTEASGNLAGARVELDAAKIALNRAERLLRDNAGSEREVDEARARTALAEASLQAAANRQAALEKAIVSLEEGTVSAIPIFSPIDGILTEIHAGPGQQVPAAAPLFRVTDVSNLWLRLPVYVGDLATIDTSKEVAVRDLAAAPGSPGATARPVSGPPSADPEAATVDFFYAVDGASGRFRPGQRVGVTVSLRVPEDSLVVPWAAVLHDIHGGTWVYVREGGSRFRRRRIEVRHVVGGAAVLGRGPGVGTPVVTDGAAELFGTEFGIGK